MGLSPLQWVQIKHSADPEQALKSALASSELERMEAQSLLYQIQLAKWMQ